MRARRYALVVSVLAVMAGGLATGCGEISKAEVDGGMNGDGGSTGDGGGGVDAATGPCSGAMIAYDDFFDCVQGVACGLFERCLGDFGSFNCDTLPFDGIIGDNARSVAEPFFRDAIEAGTVSYDASIAATCLNDVSGLACADLFTDENPFQACGIFTGKVAPGAECFNEWECAGGGAVCEKPTSCDNGGVCCAGLCRAPSPTGGMCSSGQGCMPGDHCASGTCRSGAVGSPCNGSYDCDDQLWCNAGMCAADFASGGNCINDDQCPSPEVCVGTGLMPPQGKCGRVDTVGAPCEGGAGSCYEGLYCLQPQATVLGTCQPTPALGESCAASNYCGQFLFCNAASVCEDLAGSGEPCGGAGSVQCNPGLFCTNQLSGNPTGVCTARQGANQVCNSGSQCQSGICQGGVCGGYPGCFL